MKAVTDGDIAFLRVGKAWVTRGEFANFDDGMCHIPFVKEDPSEAIPFVVSHVSYNHGTFSVTLGCPTITPVETTGYFRESTSSILWQLMPLNLALNDSLPSARDFAQGGHSPIGWLGIRQFGWPKRLIEPFARLYCQPILEGQKDSGLLFTGSPFQLRIGCCHVGLHRPHDGSAHQVPCLMREANNLQWSLVKHQDLYSPLAGVRGLCLLTRGSQVPFASPHCTWNEAEKCTCESGEHCYFTAKECEGSEGRNTNTL